MKTKTNSKNKSTEVEKQNHHQKTKASGKKSKVITYRVTDEKQIQKILKIVDMDKMIFNTDIKDFVLEID